MTSDLRHDAIYATRQMRAAPGFTLVAVLTLALGIGANTAIFSVVNGVLLRPLPFRNADGLVRIVDAEPPPGPSAGGPLRLFGVSIPELVSLRSQITTFSHVGAYVAATMTLTSADAAVRLDGYRVSPSILAMLGQSPELGRVFETNEEAPGADAVLILSHAVWQRQFQGDPGIIGRSVRLEARDYSVVGVMGPRFQFPDAQTQFWVPYVLATALPQTRLVPLARLSDGVSLQSAQAALATMLPPIPDAPAPPPPPAPRAPGGPNAIGPLRPGPPPPASGARQPAQNAARSAAAPARFRLIRLQDQLVDSVRPALQVLAVTVGLVLLIACANVASLLLARASARQREIAVRVALGAGRGRLLRQFMTESMMLALAGGAAGAGLAFVGIRLLRILGAVLPRRDMGPGVGLPRLDEIGIDQNVLLFSLAISVATGVLFGLVPVRRRLQTSSRDVLGDGRASSPSGFNLLRRDRVRGGLIVSEIAMAVTLLVGGALLIRSFVMLSNVDPGYDAKNVLTFHVSLAGGQSASARLPIFAEDFVDRLRSINSVRAAGYTQHLPMIQRRTVTPLRRTPDLPAQPPPPPAAPGQPGFPEYPDTRMVSHGFLDVMGIRVIAGRGLNEGDRAGQKQVMVINQTLARSGFLGDSPIGQQIYAQGRTPWEIVGIVEDVRQYGLDEPPGPQVFVDQRQILMNGVAPTGVVEYFAIRTDGDPLALVPTIRDLVRQFDPTASLDNVATMEQIVANSISRRRLYAVLLGVFASVAVLLAAVGVYGVMSFGVSQRTRELGIRIALGGSQSQVLRLVLSECLVLIAIGTGFGLLGAVGVSGYLKGLLFGVSAVDPPTLIVVAVTFAAIATIAALIPARRATAVDPMVALRCD